MEVKWKQENQKYKQAEEDNIIEEIEERIIRNINNLFVEEEDYYKPLRTVNFYGNNYIEYESNGDRNKTLSFKEYLGELKLYLKDTINNLKKFDTWKIQLAMVINFISSKNTDEEACNAFK